MEFERGNLKNDFHGMKLGMPAKNPFALSVIGIDQTTLLIRRDTFDKLLSDVQSSLPSDIYNYGLNQVGFLMLSVLISFP